MSDVNTKPTQPKLNIFNSLLSLASKFIDSNKLGGWIRAIVAAGFVALIAKYPIFGTYIDPALQTQIAAAIAAAVVGVWSQLTKTDAAAIAKVAAMPDVEKIVVQPAAGDGVGAALADPSQTKVVSK